VRRKSDKMTINVLPDVLANKIAAGEVVERPASVVKELVENSIDAKSTLIKVELKEAGLEQICVTDNGIGMSATDCERAFLRHATSKIDHDRDLFHIKTLGFRGEALASIAAVSQLTLQSSQGNEAGTLLALDGGKIISRAKSDARQGTKITVNHLFYNTPARLKYMKTIHTELGHITDLLNRMAFAHPHIRFDVFHNGKRLFRTSGANDLRQVISQIYGLNVAQKMLAVEKNTLDFQIDGYLSKPELTRASRNYITTIINGRYIRSPLLFKAIMRAYHTLLPIHRYPIVVLNIQMDPVLVDVNVHPTKLEVRFSKDQELMEVVEQSLYETLSETRLIPEVKRANHRENSPVQQTINFQQTDPKLGRRQPFTVNNAGKSLSIKENNHAVKTSENDHLIEPIKHEQPLAEASTPTKSVDKRIPEMYPIGQLHGTYILAQNENGLYMIDQHAAQERIKYEYYQQKLANPHHESQDLLMPITFEFTKSEAIFIEQFKEELASIGLNFETFGKDSYIIRSYPTWFPEGLEEQIIRDLVEQIMQEGMIDIRSLREEAAITLACKRSIKANEYLNIEAMNYLLNDLQQTKDPFTCPHGRPIIVHFSTNDIEKMFKRIM